MIDERLLGLTEKNEGYREFMYECTAGKKTIAIGLNLEAGISLEEARVILKMRMDKIYDQFMNKFDWFYGLNDARQAALCDMAYQLGFVGVCKFVKSLKLVEQGNYQAASIEFLNSKWARQTSERAVRITRMIASGEFA